ncbi:hypothetical protein JOQ06_030012 [Pogonophryne albipinna]|uniref:Uncharacterized protein n=1 Tax=Pogonophryne albipinna TaxID=1090488 RepID=A0AAD6FGU8_9TELE|nr:hypothetical protein JOQ06_030012 [Pogonophryne albipinna]
MGERSTVEDEPAAEGNTRAERGEQQECMANANEAQRGDGEEKQTGEEEEPASDEHRGRGRKNAGALQRRR